MVGVMHMMLINWVVRVTSDGVYNRKYLMGEMGI